MTPKERILQIVDGNLPQSQVDEIGKALDEMIACTEPKIEDFYGKILQGITGDNTNANLHFTDGSYIAIEASNEYGSSFEFNVLYVKPSMEPSYKNLLEDIKKK